MAQGPLIDADVQQKMDEWPNAYHPLILTIKLERQPLDLAKLLPTVDELNACTQAWQDWETLVERKKKGEEISDGEIKYFLEIAQRLDSAICEKQDTAYRDDYNACMEQSVPKVVYELKQLLGKRVREPQAPSQLIGVKALKAELNQIVAIPGVQRVSYDLQMAAMLDKSHRNIQAHLVHHYFGETGFTGARVKVAVVDDGVRWQHSRIPDTDPVNERDWTNSGTSSACTSGHGTKVAGIIVCQPSALDERLGVAYNAILVSAKVDHNGGQMGCPPPPQGEQYYLERWDFDKEAFAWATTLSLPTGAPGPAAQVVNFSRGAILLGENDTSADHFSSKYVDWIVYSSGATFVHSCGNQPVAQQISPPSGAYNCISVGNYDDQNSENRTVARIDTTTSDGPTDDGRRKPDVCAPGHNINAPNAHSLNDGFVDDSGTSFAAPHVAGVCALLKEARPSLQPRQMCPILINSADFMTDLYGNGTEQNGWHGETGWGMLNAYSAVDQRFNIVDGVVNDPSDSRTYAVAIVPPGQNTVVTLTWQRVMTSDASPLVDSNGWESPARLDLVLEGYREGSGWQELTRDVGAHGQYAWSMSNARQVRAQQSPPGEPQYTFRVRVEHNSDPLLQQFQGVQYFTVASRNPFAGGF